MEDPGGPGAAVLPGNRRGGVVKGMAYARAWRRLGASSEPQWWKRGGWALWPWAWAPRGSCRAAQQTENQAHGGQSHHCEGCPLGVGTDSVCGGGAGAACRTKTLIVGMKSNGRPRRHDVGIGLVEGRRVCVPGLVTWYLDRGPMARSGESRSGTRKHPLRVTWEPQQ